jgi:hypothetical protein
MPRKSVLKLTLVGLLLAADFTGCQRLGPAAGSAPGSAVVAELGRGTLTGHKYTNDYFKLTVDLPEQWYVQSQEEAEQLQQVGSQVATGKGSNPNLKKAMAAAQAKTLTLVAAFQQKPGTPIPFNANVMVLAERVNHMPGIRSGADYCEQLKKALSMTALKYVFEPVEPGHKIGSMSAYCLPLHANFGGIEVKQRCYATRYKDYALAVILSYATDEQRKITEGIVANIKAGAD